MNALPQIKEATKIASRPWTALVQPCMGLWEPVIRPNGKPRVYNSEGVARGIAKGFPGSTTVYMGWSLIEPTLEAIRAVANPPRTPSVPVFDLAPTESDRLSTDAWRC